MNCTLARSICVFGAELSLSLGLFQFFEAQFAFRCCCCCCCDCFSSGRGVRFLDCLSLFETEKAAPDAQAQFCSSLDIATLFGSLGFATQNHPLESLDLSVSALRNPVCLSFKHNCVVSYSHRPSLSLSPFLSPSFFLFTSTSRLSIPSVTLRQGIFGFVGLRLFALPRLGGK